MSVPAVQDQTYADKAAVPVAPPKPAATTLEDQYDDEDLPETAANADSSLVQVNSGSQVAPSDTTSELESFASVAEAANNAGAGVPSTTNKKRKLHFN